MKDKQNHEGASIRKRKFCNSYNDNKIRQTKKRYAISEIVIERVNDGQTDSLRSFASKNTEDKIFCLFCS